jgi:uncharacterized lipoprotein YajG
LAQRLPFVAVVRIMLTVVLAAAVVGGCASASSTAIYEKPGVAEEQKRVDQAACARAAIDNADQRGAAYLAVDRDVVDRCMVARGYRVTAPK